MGMEADIATIKTHVEYIRAKADKDDVRAEKLEARVKDLETGTIKTRAYAAGFGAAASLVATYLGKFLLPMVLLLVLAPACAHAPDLARREVQVPFRWVGEMPIAISDAMSPACVESVLEAVEWWKEMGAPMEVRGEDRQWLGFHGFCPNGQVCVVQGPPTNPGAAAETTVSLYERDPSTVASAEIVFEECSVAIARHELGHALGLLDLYGSDDVGNVMFFAVGGVGEKLTPDQVSWVLP